MSAHRGSAGSGRHPATSEMRFFDGRSARILCGVNPGPRNMSLSRPRGYGPRNSWLERDETQGGAVHSLIETIRQDIDLVLVGRGFLPIPQQIKLCPLPYCEETRHQEGTKAVLQPKFCSRPGSWHGHAATNNSRAIMHSKQPEPRKVEFVVHKIRCPQRSDRSSTSSCGPK